MDLVDKTDRNREEDYFYPPGAECTVNRQQIRVSSLRIFFSRDPSGSLQGFFLGHH